MTINPLHISTVHLRLFKCYNHIFAAICLLPGKFLFFVFYPFQVGHDPPSPLRAVFQVFLFLSLHDDRKQALINQQSALIVQLEATVEM